MPLRGRIALTLIAATCAVASSAGAAQAASTSVPCPDVEIVGLRGSGEPMRTTEHDMGSLVGPVADAVAFQLSGAATVGFYGVPYQAIKIDWKTLTGPYFDSKKEGETMLKDHLSARFAACPSTKFIVMGYSQGAHAAGDLLARQPASFTARIAALVMFGDPRFNPDADYVWGSYDPRDHGVAGARSIGDFATWKSRVASFCRNGDIVCQGLGWGHGTDPHGQSEYRRDYEFLAAGLARRAAGFSAAAKLPLDLAFVIDSTGSMGGAIDGVADTAAAMAKRLKEQGKDSRFGLVDYKDTDQGDPYGARVDLGFTTDDEAFKSAVEGLSASGGGDTPEAVYSGLMTAFTKLSWRPGSRKAVVLMGDAPAKDPEPVTGYTGASVTAAARSLPAPSRVTDTDTPADSEPESAEGSSVPVYPLEVGEGSSAGTFAPLATGTGGTLFNTSAGGGLTDALIGAVDAATAPVNVTLAAPGQARTNSDVQLVATATYDGGPIARFDWDFDGDGATDATTAGGAVIHRYTTPFEGTIKVTAVTEDGHDASAFTSIRIADGVPSLPAAPTPVTVEPTAAGEARVTWGAAAGGGPFLGFQVRIQPAAVDGSDQVKTVSGDATAATFASLKPGAYVAGVTAINDAGPSPETTQPFVMPAPATVPTGPTGGGTTTQTAEGSGSPASSPAAIAVSVLRGRWTGRRFRTSVACPATAGSACTVRLALQRGRGRVFRTERSVVVTVRPGTRRAVKVRLTAKQVRRLRAAPKRRLAVTTRTRFGTVTRVLSLPRPPKS